MCTSDSTSGTCTTYVLHNQKLRVMFRDRLLATPTLTTLGRETDEFKIIYGTLQLWTESKQKYRRMSAAMAHVCSRDGYPYVLMRPCLSLIDEARGDLLREIRE